MTFLLPTCSLCYVYVTSFPWEYVQLTEKNIYFLCSRAKPALEKDIPNGLGNIFHIEYNNNGTVGAFLTKL